MKTSLIFAIILIGCSPSFKAQKHLRKAQKHILKAESFGATWGADTVYKEISIIRPEIRHDTVVSLVGGDTVTIEKERLKIKILRLPGDSVFIEGACLADTVVKEVPITVTRTIHAPKNNSWRTAAFSFAGMLILLIAAVFFWFRAR